MSTDHQPRMSRRTALQGLSAAALSGPAAAGAKDAGGVDLRRDAEAGTLDFLVDGRTVTTYQHAAKWALPHLHPVRSPSGKLLTAQVPDPFPHHRSLWLADKVQFGDHEPVDFYHCWKNYIDEDEPDRGYQHYIRHRRFISTGASERAAHCEAELEWVLNREVAILGDRRRIRVARLNGSEYLIDLSWSLTAPNGDVRFVSDWVHYAWPYIRMHPQFSGKRGGTITDSHGRTGQKATNSQNAEWLDYSNTVGGATEGLAVFIHGGQPRQWLTREYGCFGPKRPDRRNGEPFTLSRGQSLGDRVGILVHRGDVRGGRVAERYEQYISGEL